MDVKQAFATFVSPPREFGPIPFWFLNDDLEEGELLRQLRALHEAHYGGFVLHARVGLSRRVGYLTDEFFRLARLLVAEAARLGMKVILYDEGSYPSGSAQGAVVAENPDYASRAMGMWERTVEGPFAGFWRPNTGRGLLDRHVCTVVGRRTAAGGVDSGSARVLNPLPNDIFRIEVPAGQWTAMSVWHTASGGHIRGVFADEESGSLTAPAAGDILNPDAVACFLRLTHDRYYEHLKEFFGTTIIAIFTDEPQVMGRNPLRPANPMPFTPGLIEWLAERWGEDPRPWLPALWVDCGPGTGAFRRRFKAAIQERLEEVFFAVQSRWCAEHGIALTGHPAESEELSPLRWFQLPGQDMVWRYVESDQPTAIEGRHSVAAKVATSGARIQGARRILTEVCGAYGWRLTLEEMKWLFDWHLVRGNNLIDPHAVFYSIRGRRAWESEPDLCLHNTWRPYVGLVNRYAQRLSWLLCDGTHVCDVAILGDGNAIPWQAAKQLYQRQIDFLYLDQRAVGEAAVDGATLAVGTQSYRVVVVDGDPALGEDARRVLQEFAAVGGHIVEFTAGMELPAGLAGLIDDDLRIDPPHPDLRFIHYRKGGLDFYLLVNEGGGTIDGEVSLRTGGRIECWDALAGVRRPACARTNAGGLVVAVHLPRRESVVLAVDRRAEFTPVAAAGEWVERRLSLDVPWQVFGEDGEPVAGLGLGDWSHHPGLELFSGTLCYRTVFTIPDAADQVGLDLGAVGDIAEVTLDGKPARVRMWAPYRVVLAGPVTPGRHRLEVRVTNSMANAYEGAQLPSGLMGPVQLILRQRQSLAACRVSGIRCMYGVWHAPMSTSTRKPAPK